MSILSFSYTFYMYGVHFHGLLQLHYFVRVWWDVFLSMSFSLISLNLNIKMKLFLFIYIPWLKFETANSLKHAIYFEIL